MLYFGSQTCSEYNNCTLNFVSKFYNNSQLMETDKQQLTDKLMLCCNLQVMESACKQQHNER